MVVSMTYGRCDDVCRMQIHDASGVLRTLIKALTNQESSRQGLGPASSRMCLSLHIVRGGTWGKVPEASMKTASRGQFIHSRLGMMAITKFPIPHFFPVSDGKWGISPDQLGNFPTSRAHSACSLPHSFLARPVPQTGIRGILTSW